MTALERITRMVELEPDPFKRLDMVRHLRKVEQQLRELNQKGR